MKHKAVFLIFSLWLFVLLAVFSLGLGFRTFVEVKKTKLFLDSLRARHLAASGISLAQAVLEEDEAGVDYLGEEWAQALEQELEYFSPRREKEEVKLTVKIEDESARLNINKAKDSPELLEELFRQMGLDDPETKARHLVDYIDADSDSSLSGTVSEADNMKNGALKTAEELLLLPEMTPGDYDNLAEWVTVFGDEKLNLNTIKEELLTVLAQAGQGGLGPALIPEITAAREEGYYQAAGCGADSEGCNTLPAVAGLNNVFKTNSDIFRVVSQAEVGEAAKKITCVVHRKEGIIYWYEQ